MHYDIDVSHIFLTQFHGRKRVMLVAPEQTKRMYKLPLSFHAHEDIDWRNPDYDRFPALRGVKGMGGVLEHSETLFMPTGWWHYMEYLEGGFAISLRAIASPSRAARGIWNVAFARANHNFAATHRARYFDWKRRRGGAIECLFTFAGVPQPFLCAHDRS